MPRSRAPTQQIHQIAEVLKRLNESSWVNVLKTLVVTHRLLRDGHEVGPFRPPLAVTRRRDSSSTS